MNTVSTTKEINVLNLFGKALPGNSVSFDKINIEANKRGYIVHPDCCTIPVLNWLKSKPVDFNATFYKEWAQIESKTRLQIWMDQVLNYIHNYGAGFSVTQNDGSDQPTFDSFKLISPITEQELEERALSMLYAKIAYKQETIEEILSLVNTNEVNVDLILNREAKMIVCSKLNLIPTDPIEIVRFIVYSLTGKSLLIKDKETLDILKKVSNVPQIINIFKSVDLEKLSEVFFRFKLIFLAIKNKNTASYVNKLRKMANKFHKPLVNSFFNSLLSMNSIPTNLSKQLETCDNFTKVKLLQTISVRLNENDISAYPIRNGKIYIKPNCKLSKDHYTQLYDIILDNLVKSLSDKATTVYLPKGVEYKLPTSEKMFIGNFPIGTSFDFSGQNAIIGIHRKKENAAGFFDFSLNNNGQKIGWDAKFKDDSIMFSGDICHNDKSNPAVELFYAENGFNENYIAKINNYDKLVDEIPYSLFLAIEKIDKLKKNYMVDPNNIVFNIDLVAKSTEVSVGVLAKNKFILAEFRTGNKVVAGKSITNLYADYAINNLNTYLDLEEILKKSKFIFVNNPKDAELDLSIDCINKDTFINLLK